MNCYSAKELADSFRTVRKNTLVIAQDLPEEKYTFRPVPDTRSPGELLPQSRRPTNSQNKITPAEPRTTREDFDFPAIIKALPRGEKDPATKTRLTKRLRE